MRATALLLSLLVLAVVPASTDARQARPVPVEKPPPTTRDDLYRRKGYGTGGLLFGNSAQAGTCADLAFARPRNCGPQGGYGIYGNGLGYGF